jgi:hypothetical protein
MPAPFAARSYGAPGPQSLYLPRLACVHSSRAWVVQEDAPQREHDSGLVQQCINHHREKRFKLLDQASAAASMSFSLLLKQ